MKYYRVAFFNEIGEAVSPLDIKAGTMAEAKKTYLDRVREAVGQKIVGVEIPTKEAKKREVKEMAKIKETKKTQEVKASVKENTEVKKMAKTTRTKKSEVKAMASYELNKEHNGVEIKFIEKPEVEIREALKKAGFRWHNTKQVWYAKQSEKTLTLAKKLTDEEPKAKAEPKAKKSTKKTEPKANAVVQENKERGGIEIKFTDKPSDEVRKALKDAGFHWNPKTEVWYAKATKETVKKANEIAKAA